MREDYIIYIIIQQMQNYHYVCVICSNKLCVLIIIIGVLLFSVYYKRACKLLQYPFEYCNIASFFLRVAFCLEK